MEFPSRTPQKETADAVLDRAARFVIFPRQLRDGNSRFAFYVGKETLP
jgi:hypothetical protein